MRKLIDQQEAIESLKECAEAVRNNGEFDIERGYLNAIECLEEEPSVDAVPARRGKWILQGDRRKTLYGWYFCSECGACIGGKTNFCSECGADMRGEQHEG